MLRSFSKAGNGAGTAYSYVVNNTTLVGLETSSAPKTPRGNAVLNEADPRSKKERITSRIIWSVSAVSSLIILNERLVNSITQLPLALIVVVGWLAVAYRAYKFYAPRRPPAWHRYLWPLALPVCAIVLQFGTRQDETIEDTNFDVWVVLFIYAISTVIIAAQVRRVLLFASNNGGEFTRDQYRAALRTARALLWVLPVFFLVALLSEYAFGSADAVAKEFLNAVRNQVFGVIGAASTIAAFTAVPSEARAFRKDFSDKVQYDALRAEMSNIRMDVDSLRRGIGEINDELHQIKVEQMNHPRGPAFGSVLRALATWPSIRMNRG